MLSLENAIAAREYPGRACVAARLDDGAIALAYFVTGRSEASRARTIRAAGNGNLTVGPRDATAPADGLRHYVAGTQRGDWTVIGNGSQVGEWASALNNRAGAIEAWTAFEHEPDPPIFTSRICMAVVGRRLLVAAASKAPSPLSGTEHYLRESAVPSAGYGVMIATYKGPRDEPTTDASPLDVSIRVSNHEELLTCVWDALDSRLRVSAAALRSGELSNAAILNAG